VLNYKLGIKRLVFYQIYHTSLLKQHLRRYPRFELTNYYVFFAKLNYGRKNFRTGCFKNIIMIGLLGGNNSDRA
jgi:hypothetical protein